MLCTNVCTISGVLIAYLSALVCGQQMMNGFYSYRQSDMLLIYYRKNTIGVLWLSLIISILYILNFGFNTFIVQWNMKGLFLFFIVTENLLKYIVLMFVQWLVNHIPCIGRIRDIMVSCRTQRPPNVCSVVSAITKKVWQNIGSGSAPRLLTFQGYKSKSSYLLKTWYPMSSLTWQLNEDFVLIHQTFGIAVTWHYLSRCHTWAILT